MTWLIASIFGIVGLTIGYFVSKRIIEEKVRLAKQDYDSMIEKAKKEATEIKKRR